MGSAAFCSGLVQQVHDVTASSLLTSGAGKQMCTAEGVRFQTTIPGVEMPSPTAPREMPHPEVPGAGMPPSPDLEIPSPKMPGPEIPDIVPNTPPEQPRWPGGDPPDSPDVFPPSGPEISPGGDGGGAPQGSPPGGGPAPGSGVPPPSPPGAQFAAPDNGKFAGKSPEDFGGPNAGTPPGSSSMDSLPKDMEGRGQPADIGIANTTQELSGSGGLRGVQEGRTEELPDHDEALPPVSTDFGPHGNPTTRFPGKTPEKTGDATNAATGTMNQQAPIKGVVGQPAEGGPSLQDPTTMPRPKTSAV